MLKLMTVLVTIGTVQAGCELPNIPNTGELESDSKPDQDGRYPEYSSLFIRCLPGYELLGTDMLFCLRDSTWDPLPGDVQCKESGLKCADADIPVGGSVSGGRDEGDRAIYSCDNHLILVGNEHRTCQGGKWQGNMPHCDRAVQCEDPGIIANSQRVDQKLYNLTNFGPGDTIQYRCNHGEVRQADLLCLNRGEWNQQPPVCPEKKASSPCDELQPYQMCPDPGPPRYGYLLKQDTVVACYGRYPPGQTIKFRCNDGFLFVNKQPINRLTCLKGGSWDRDLPICYDQTTLCPDPGSIAHGERSPPALGLGVLEGTSIKFQCDYGYKVDDRFDWSTMRCLDSGRWDADKPTCTELICPRPPIPANGRVLTKYERKTEFKVNESVTFLCQEGYQLEGPHVLTCIQDVLGWDHLPPVCKVTDPIDIPISTYPWIRKPRVTEPTPRESIRQTTTDSARGYPRSTTPGDLGTFTATPDSRHTTKLPSKSDNRPSLTWTVSIATPTISENAPNQPPLRVTPTTPAPTRATLITRSPRKATPTAPTPTTPAHTTPTPTTPAHTTRGSQTTPRRTQRPAPKPTPNPAKGEGLKVITTETKPGGGEDLDHGNRKQNPVCNDPGYVRNADRTPVFDQDEYKGFDVGKVIKVVCKEGFAFEEEFAGLIYCRASGKWDKLPRCVSSSNRLCVDPGKVDNAIRSPEFVAADDLFAVGETIDFICNHGYSAGAFYDQISLTCLENGSWDGVLPVCSEIRCQAPDVPLHSTILPDNQSSFAVDSSVTFQCEPGYELRGPERLTCEHYSAEWSAWVPDCNAIACPDPGWPENGRRIGNDFREGQSVRFQCLSGYELRGSPNRTCQGTRKWSGKPAVCDKGGSRCPPLPDVIGGTKTGRFYDAGDVVRYSCETDFYLVGSPRRKCLYNGMWSGRDSHCEYLYSYSDTGDVENAIREGIDALATLTTSSTTGAELRTGNCQNRITSGALDLYLVLDVSGSIKKKDLDFAKTFAKAIVDKVGVSETGTRVALIVFDTRVQSHLKITDPDRMTPERVKAQIESIPHYGRGTATASALRYIRDRLLDKATGRQTRTYARNALILITDGRHNTGGDPVPVAEDLKMSPFDMDIYCLAIGHNVNKRSVHQIASSPDKFWYLRRSEDIGPVTEHLLSTSETRYEQCGVGGVVDIPETVRKGGGFPVKDIRHWPWVATIHLKTAPTHLL
ncbi:sushi, von Willebrand factor type A, EGF and pentraxin domain-containing protein 1-like [Liolophura sinensis]|uniref:sushi, von Willebrand factor type A, EGF and pentraxin domain-containing protein 1-like n=1 Tax=Liolophura sinensis TaxID=3198878 RepID=UPI0031583F2F